MTTHLEYKVKRVKSIRSVRDLSGCPAHDSGRITSVSPVCIETEERIPESLQGLSSPFTHDESEDTTWVEPGSTG